MILATGLTFTILPREAGAFWIFQDAVASSRATVPLVHNSSISMLRAATNINPNASFHEGTIAMTNGSALIAQAGPEGTAADINPAAANGQISLYVVRPGDSLSEISQMFGVSVNTILWANNIKDARLITPGTTLLILPVSGVRHTVLRGETIASIARKYHADKGDIALYNGIGENAKLVTGKTILIPGGEMPMAVHSKRRVLHTSRRIKRAPSNPYRGGSGPLLPWFFSNPLPGGILTQGLHGWNAVDIGARTGTPIHAAASGRIIVSRIGGWNGGYGNYVVIDHGNGTQTLYAHMVKDISSVGQSVKKGQIIGYVGETGEATGPHLHFEVRGAKNPFVGCTVGRVVSSACALH